MKKALYISCICFGMIIYFIYLCVHVGFDTHSHTTTYIMYNTTCEGKNNKQNVTSVENVYGFCPDFKIDESSKLALFLCNIFFIAGSLSFWSVIGVSIETSENIFKEMKSKNEDLRSLLSDKEIHMTCLQARLADRRLIVKIAARRENTPPNTEEENGSLLTQTRYPDYHQ